MEQGLNTDSDAPPHPIDKSRVYEVRPIRSLVPIFPNTPGLSSVSNPNPSPFVCVSPSGPFPPGVQPFYPFLVSNDSHPTTGTPQNQRGIPSPVPLNSFRTPKSRGPIPIIEDDGYSDSQSGFSMNVGDVDGASNSVKRRGRPRKRKVGNDGNGNVEEIDAESILDGFLTSFKLKEFDDVRRSNGDKDTTRTILLVFDLIRRRLTQLEEARDANSGFGSRRPDLKASNLLMTKGVRTNNSKRIGHVGGVDIGDIFFFRMETCLVGLHAPTMAGIDYMSVKKSVGEEPFAVSIVSSGGYEDEDGDDSNVLIYSGQGGVQRRDGQMFDQKLERGNLALEKSLHRGNDVRVIRGLKDTASTGKIYVYDGLYKIQESWAEKNKSGCQVFKYKLVRQPGQAEAFSLWKSIQQWRDGNSTRPGLIIPDLTSGSESQPVALVNEVDAEKGPPHFSYISSLKYLQPFPAPTPFLGCHCLGGCQPGDANCSCSRRNDGLLPYSSLGVVLTTNSVIHECGLSCSCPSNCRNRLTQSGVKFRLEVFKTESKGWGVRSWDPIRAGSFICEYAGDVIKISDFDHASDDNCYIFDANRHYEPLELVCDSTSSRKSPFPLIVSAKNSGNVSRFMNHSCSPNVFWKPIVRGSNNDVFLHVGFFAIRHIPPLQELVYDYGTPEKAEVGKKKCLCGSEKCRGFFY